MVAMHRRQLLAGLAGAVTTPIVWPIAAQAQPAMPVVGLLGGASASASEQQLAAFRRGLREAGYVEGQNVAIEYRWADGQYDRIPEMAAEFVRRGVAVIVTFGGTLNAQVAKAATSTIPIVFSLGSDPVAMNLVASMSRPGGNITGATNLTVTLAQKRLEVLHELVPAVNSVAFLANAASSTNDQVVREMETAAKTLGIQVRAMNVQNEGDLVPAFENIFRQQLRALVVGGDPFHFSKQKQIVALAARYRVPATYYRHEAVIAGGLMSYGSVTSDSYRGIGLYVGRILKGEKPADLPVLQPTKFELLINLKTARTLGLEVPTSILLRATEVIE